MNFLYHFFKQFILSHFTNEEKKTQIVFIAFGLHEVKEQIFVLSVMCLI